MGNALNIRDIGDDRKRAVAEEAQARGVSVAELVRAWIDEGLDAARRTREREEWQREAAKGIEAEQIFLDRHGPTLSRYRLGSPAVPGGNAGAGLAGDQE